MSNKLISIVVLLILTSCGAKQYQEPSLSSLISEFEETYKVTTQNVEIKILPRYEGVSKYTLGWCQMGASKIEIFEDTWNRVSPTTRKIILYHELGHCLFARYHNEEYLEDRCPKSIMFTYLLGDYCFEKHKDYYIEELYKAQ